MKYVKWGDVMKITYMIGNGFDLNLKMETGYRHFYSYLKKSRKKRNPIIDAIQHNSDCWSDLEMGLGKYLANITPYEIESFIRAKCELEELLRDYLWEQNRRLVFEDIRAVAQIVKDNITTMDHLIPDKYQMECKAFLDTQPEYAFITFNYTDALDRIVEAIQFDEADRRIEKPLHIHGDLNRGMILGINDEDQINNLTIRKNQFLQDCMVKFRMNEALNTDHTAAGQAMIDDSRYVCLYGLSVGDTDILWWKYLMEWLIKDPKNRLVLFVRETKRTDWTATGQILFETDKRNEFLKKGQYKEAPGVRDVKEQIIIVPNSKIFDVV